jgi:hypothetical protein
MPEYIHRTVLFSSPDYTQDDESKFHDAVKFNEDKTKVISNSRYDFDEDSECDELIRVGPKDAQGLGTLLTVIEGDYYHSKASITIKSYLKGVADILKEYNAESALKVTKETLVDVGGVRYPVIDEDGSPLICE